MKNFFIKKVDINFAFTNNLNSVRNSPPAGSWNKPVTFT